jgi:hypothetical protein
MFDFGSTSKGFPVPEESFLDQVLGEVPVAHPSKQDLAYILTKLHMDTLKIPGKGSYAAIVSKGLHTPLQNARPIGGTGVLSVGRIRGANGLN